MIALSGGSEVEVAIEKTSRIAECCSTSVSVNVQNNRSGRKA